jgi:hypothetical protein
MEAVKESLSPTIRDNFLPTDAFVSVGSHDLWEDAENDDGTFIARPFLSVMFFGYGSPLNWKEFRTRVFDIPAIQQVKRELEAVLGPLQQSVFWRI